MIYHSPSIPNLAEACYTIKRQGCQREERQLVLAKAQKILGKLAVVVLTWPV